MASSLVYARFAAFATEVRAVRRGCNSRARMLAEHMSGSKSDCSVGLVAFVQVVMPPAALRIHVAVDAVASPVCACVPAPVCVSSNRAPVARVYAVVRLRRFYARVYAVVRLRRRCACLRCRLSNCAHV